VGVKKIKKLYRRISDDRKILSSQPHRHWHYVYRHRRARKLIDDVNTWQIIAGQVFTVVASVFAGFLLDIRKEEIGVLAGAFVLMPGIIDLSASLTGAMAAKINHQIDVTPAHPTTIATHAVGFSLLVGIFAGLIVGIFGGFISFLLFDGNIVKIALLGTISMTTISLIADPVIASMTIAFKKLHMNPDNIVGPIQSSLIDMLAIIVIAAYTRVLS
jgi:cation transporter-like permease